MAENGIFNQLVSGLPLDERNSLLQKLSGASTVTREPLYQVSVEEPVPQAEKLYARLPWYSRLWLFILSFFESRSPLKLFEDRQTADAGRKIEAQWPGLYDYQRSLLLPSFYSAVTELKEGARFFYTALDASVNQDRGAFYAFLGSLEMEKIHRSLLAATEPAKILEKNPKISDAELRQEALGALEEVLGLIPGDDRLAMYTNVQALHHLKELSSFLFDRVLMAFSSHQVEGGQTCAVRLVRDMLNSLNNILYSLQAPPSIALLESMFVFILQERGGSPEFDMNKETEILMAQAEASLLSIKQFNQQVPLTRILRCAGRDMSLQPKTITGGEDWFTLYREHWKKYTEAQLGDYLGGRRRREILKDFEKFFKGVALVPLENAASEDNPIGFPLRGAFALSFLLAFRRDILLGELDHLLKLILTEGEFFKRDNRVEFTQNYERLANLDSSIGILETDISGNGSFGKRYAQIRGDMSSLPAKRRKTQMVLDEAAEKAGNIIDTARYTFQGMANLLNGIIAGNSAARNLGDKYGPLSNLDKLEEEISTTDLIAGVQKFQQALRILDDIDLMEAGK